MGQDHDYGLFTPGPMERRVLDVLAWNGPLYEYKLAKILHPFGTRNSVREALQSLQAKNATKILSIDEVIIDQANRKATVRRQRFTLTSLGLRITMPKSILLKDEIGRREWSRFIETVWQNYREFLLLDLASQNGIREEPLTIHGRERVKQLSRRRRQWRAKDQLSPEELKQIVQAATWTPSAEEVQLQVIRKRQEGTGKAT